MTTSSPETLETSYDNNKNDNNSKMNPQDSKSANCQEQEEDINNKSSTTSSPDDSDSDPGKYMMFHHRSDDDDDDDREKDPDGKPKGGSSAVGEDGKEQEKNSSGNNDNHSREHGGEEEEEEDALGGGGGTSHVIPKSPDHRAATSSVTPKRASVSLRGSRTTPSSAITTTTPRRPPVFMPYRVGGPPIPLTGTPLGQIVQTSSSSLGATGSGIGGASGGDGVKAIAPGAPSGGYEIGDTSLGVSTLYHDHAFGNGGGGEVAVAGGGFGFGRDDNNNIITPANSNKASTTAGGTPLPTRYMYPPSSPIEAGLDPNPSPSPKGASDNEGYVGEESGENSNDMWMEWIPPQNNKSRKNRQGSSHASQDVVLEARPPHHDDPMDSMEPARIKPQFVRAKPAKSAATAYPKYKQRPHHSRPPLVVDSSHSNDSADALGSTLRGGVAGGGGRVQVVGGGIESNPPWSFVSHSRSAESGASEEWDTPRHTALPFATPDREGPRSRRREVVGNKGPSTSSASHPPTPHDYGAYGHSHSSYSPYEYPHPYEASSRHSPTVPSSSSPYGHPPPPHAYGHPPPYTPDHYSRERPPPGTPREWHTPTTPSYPPRGPHPPQSEPRYDFHRGRYSYPPPGGGSYPPPPTPSQYRTPYREVDVDEVEEEEPHPLLKDYNPHFDGIRPQFRNTKKNETQERDESENPSRKRRRRRQPTEKAAAAAAMAAAAAAAAAAAKERKAKLAQQKPEGGEDDEGEASGDKTTKAEPDKKDDESEEELRNLDPGSDEDIPASKRAAMASAAALRAAAGGSPLEPPKAASEVDFDIADPPLHPVHPPSAEAVLDSATMMTENDVLCGRGGGTNSQMGNRRFRSLVRDFQPTYLMARRREKPLMARSVVLIVRKRGGRFLRRDESDGRLYEVGDEKAEAKTSQALREGLDVRATKTAANTLMGTDGSRRRKRTPVPKESAAVSVTPATKGEPPSTSSREPKKDEEATPAKTQRNLPPTPGTRRRHVPPPNYPPTPHGGYAPPPPSYSYYPPPPPRYDDAYYRHEYGPPTPRHPHHPHYPPPAYHYPPHQPSAPGVHHSYSYSSPSMSYDSQFSPPRNEARKRPHQTPLTPVRSRVHP